LGGRHAREDRRLPGAGCGRAPGRTAGGGPTSRRGRDRAVARSVMSPRELRAFAKELRLVSLRMISRGGSSHVGTVFSCVETLACLYGRVLRIRPDEPEWPDRDRFVMSKGHGAAGLYAALALRGFFPRERLDEFYVDGGSLYGHVTHKGVPGVEVSTGALGHGLALAVGLAAGALRRRASWRVFVLLSDGECDE